MATQPYWDPKFMALLKSIRSTDLFSMNYDQTQKNATFIERLTGDESNYHLVTSLLNTVDLSFATKDSIRDPKLVWPRSSRVPAALNVLSMALAYQASLNPEFKEFSSVAAVKAQFDLMERCLSEHWFSLYDLRVGLIR